MAGSSDSKENPVAINVVPLVDIIFCLCIFFMCSLKFKQLEGKFDSWLPRDKGASGPSKTEDIIDEIRIAMFWDVPKQETRRFFRGREVATIEELEKLVVAARADYERLGKVEEATATIDGEFGVPWGEVIAIVNMCKKNRLEKVEFAFGAKPKEG